VSTADLVAGLLWLALTAYAVLAGADFGGGIWDLLATGPRAAEQPAVVSELEAIARTPDQLAAIQLAQQIRIAEALERIARALERSRTNQQPDQPQGSTIEQVLPR